MPRIPYNNIQRYQAKKNLIEVTCVFEGGYYTYIDCARCTWGRYAETPEGVTPGKKYIIQFKNSIPHRIRSVEGGEFMLLPKQSYGD